jgi:hypothetical protein
MQAAFDKVAPRLRTYAPALRGAIEAYLKEPKGPESRELPTARGEELAGKLDAFFANVPAGYYPPERITKTLELVRAQEVEGVVIFSAGGITSARLWGAVGEFFGR